MYAQKLPLLLWYTVERGSLDKGDKRSTTPKPFQLSALYCTTVLHCTLCSSKPCISSLGEQGFCATLNEGTEKLLLHGQNMSKTLLSSGHVHSLCHLLGSMVLAKNRLQFYSTQLSGNDDPFQKSKADMAEIVSAITTQVHIKRQWQDYLDRHSWAFFASPAPRTPYLACHYRRDPRERRAGLGIFPTVPRGRLDWRESVLLRPVLGLLFAGTPARSLQLSAADVGQESAWEGFWRVIGVPHCEILSGDDQQ